MQRLRDSYHTGWWWIGLVPLVGWIVRHAPAWKGGCAYSFATGEGG